MGKKKGKIITASAEDVARYSEGADVPTGEGTTGASPEADRAEAGVTGVEREETLESLQAQIEEYREKLLRAQAECANVSKRLRGQHAESLKTAAMALARDLLPVVDSFERTVSSLGESGADDPVVQGVKLIADQLSAALEAHGVKPIEAVGRPFDPTMHEAMLEDANSDLPPGTVAAELQRGYTMNDRVLRPSKVAVSPAAGGADRADEPAAGAARCSTAEAGQGEDDERKLGNNHADV
jgi:molecular chaperone GrpE